VIAAAWTLDALCAEPAYAEVNFFPHPKVTATPPAVGVCRRCLVVDECLAHALEHDIRDGVWGGLTERERRVMVTARRQPAQRRRGA
jgi:WhiB family redox-sensing transcriptional regulator